jgi:hypothetical protein
MSSANVLAGLLLTFLLAGISSAEAQLTTVGVLTCTLATAVESKPGDMDCGFKPTGKGQEEKFAGHIRGRMLEGSGKLVLVWAVFAATNAAVSGGLLAQRYVRVTVAAGQPPLWVGERNKRIMLQFETNNGGGADRGIAEIELKLTGTTA